MKRTVLVFGLIAGVIMSAMMAVTMPFARSIGFDKMLVVGYTTIVAGFLLVYFGIRSYRDNVAGGSLAFGRGLIVGLLIVLIASLCYTATWEYVYPRYASDFGEQYTQYELDKAKQAGKSDAEILKIKAEQQQAWESYKNPMVRMAYSFLEPAPVGLIIALISAGILRRKTTERRV